MKESKTGIQLFKKRSRIPFLVVLVLGFLFVITPEVNAYLTDWASQQWKPTEAEITNLKSDITVKLKDPYFDVIVEYKYKVFGKEYQGNRFSFLKKGPYLGYDMGLLTRKHKLGGKIDVMVEPGEPQNSTVKTTPDHALMFSHFLAVFMVFALMYISTYPPVASLEEES